MAPEIKYTKLFIDNKWVDSVSGKKFDTYNPHDESVIASVAEGDKADIDLAVAAAKRAFQHNSEWRRMSATQRGAIINKFGQLIARDAEYLAQLESYNNGMVYTRAKMMMTFLPNSVFYFASLADKVEGTTIPVESDKFAYTLKQPVGVCGLILPWNGPVAMFLNKVCTALAAGCTMVVKPAEQTPLTALVLAALLAEAGVPAGVVNVVNGYGPTAGAALTHHPEVAKISFTGSREVGKIIQQAGGASNLKRITLELGGKSPLVIMNDANLDEAVPVAALSMYGMAGQVCVAPSRLFVQSRIYDEFVKRAVQFAKNISSELLVTLQPCKDRSELNGTVNGKLKNTTDEATMKKALEYIESGKKEGAKLMTGGKRAGNKGYYIEPTVFADVNDNMTIAKEEIFGPVQSILKFDTLEEAIARANDTSYGLAAGIMTSSMDAALEYSERVQAGIVWVNTYLSMNVQIPFGGFKDSGLGRENGSKALDAYLETKSVLIHRSKKV